MAKHIPRTSRALTFLPLWLSIMSCSSFTAPAPSGAAAVTYWRTLTGAAGDAQDELVARFNAAQDGVHVDSQFQGSYSDLAAKLTAANLSGVGPDVSQLGTFEIREMAEQGMLVDLRPYIEGPEGIDTSDWPGTMVDAGKVGEGLYWLPFNVTVPTLYYNRDAFAHAGLPGPPQTWGEFFAYAETLTTPDRAGVALWNITWPYLSIIWSEGGTLNSPDYTSITLDDPVAIEVFTRLQELVKSGAAVMPEQASGGHRAAFRSGRAAMILDSPAPYSDILAGAQGFTPDVAPYPTGMAGRVYAPGGGGIVMLTLCPEENRESAWAFVRFMLSPESLAYYAKESGYAPFTKASRAAWPELADDPRRTRMLEALPHLKGDFSLNMAPALRNAFDQAFQEIMVQGAAPATALKRAIARIRPIAPGRRGASPNEARSPQTRPRMADLPRLRGAEPHPLRCFHLLAHRV